MARIFSLIILLITITCSNSDAAKAPEKTVQWADRLLATANRPVSQWGSDCRLPWDALDANGAYLHAILKYGRDARLYAGLARSQMLLGEYSNAVRNFQSSLKLSPRDKVLKKELDLAALSESVSKLAIESLPKGHKVIRALRYSDRKGLVWLVLSAIHQKGPFDEYSDIRLTVLQKRSNQLKKLWQSDELARAQLDYANIVSLSLEDITADGKPEILVPLTFIGASWTPSYLAVYKWQNGKMRKLLGVSSELALTISDFNHDGRYEINNWHVVGWNLCHAEQPYWIDIYAYKNGAYQLADADFPWRYRELAAYIKKCLKKYPNDWELLKYQGVIYQIQRRPAAAQRYFKRALRMCRITLRDWTYSDIKPRMKYEIQDIEQRIQRF
jgi:tetratricopeptide (TPR) repeat protein